MGSLLLTFWICSVYGAGAPGERYYGSGLTREDAELSAARACFDGGNVACVVKRCGVEKREEDRD